MLMFMFMLLMFISGLSVFIMKRDHLLLMLLSLEFIVISLYLIFVFHLKMMNYEFFFSMIFLTMSVCEGVLGLSILVSIIRIHGNDNILTFSSLW
uniref:NADH-ubiquinone oxidoreductase chain 4L n=2 Tax=Acanthoscelides obtectus TaxID=200917 RepID=A0A343D0L3_ACAOB|nr:NADH dehydrogenase subunit 4L [Acanthoscelides obtectus]ARR75264.1 NADH dehydrogenase subunit 4L [Acanthoscelides obtectus]